MEELNIKKSLRLWQEAEEVIMDGTNLYSKGPKTYVFGAYPIFLEKARGCHVWDVDGNKYIDYCMSFGSVILGYAYEKVDRVVKKQIDKGIQFTLVNPLEVKVAKLLNEIFPSGGCLRFFKTGGDACAAAVRIARAYTGKEIILKGEYHGWHDALMAGSKRRAGIPKCLKNLTFYFDYGDIKSVKKIFKKYRNKVAVVVTEPVVLKPPKDFLQSLKRISHKNNSLLIFDEVNSGFRYAWGGAQKLFKVTPDLTVLGKAIANGYSLSAVLGKKKIFKKVKNKIFISTTFADETTALAASYQTLQEIKRKKVIAHIWKFGQELKEGVNRLAQRHQVNIECLGLPPRMEIVCKDKKNRESKTLKALFLQESVKRGILFGWAIMPSLAHKNKDLKETLKALNEVMAIYKKATDKGKAKDLLEGNLPRTVGVL